jgi:hypothetical protein
MKSNVLNYVFTPYTIDKEMESEKFEYPESFFLFELSYDIIESR